MFELNVIALAAATVTAFAISMCWYAVMAGQMARASGGAGHDAATGAPAPWKLGVELLRSLTVAAVMAAAATGLDISSVWAGVAVGVAAWVAFPLVLLTGSVIWDDVPPGLAAIHGADWLLKLLAITTIVTLWR